MNVTTGLTACNALSSKFIISSKRLGEQKVIRFEEGKKVSEKVTKCDPSEHGTSVTFIPNPFYLNNHDEDCVIQHEELIEWTELINHLIPEGIVTKLQVKLNNERMISKKLTNKDGQLGLIKKAVDKPLLEPIIIKDLFKFEEIDRGKKFDRYIGLEAAITFASESNGLNVQSYCNYVNTIDGGTHVDAVVNSTVRYFMKESNDRLTEREASKFKILRSDVINSLVVSINVLTNSQPQFSGQVKEKANSAMFTKVFYEMKMVYHALAKYFKDNPKELDKAVNIIKTNAKARIKANEVKDYEYKKSKTITLDLHKNDKFIQGAVRSKNQYCELLVVEGESASGGIDDKGLSFQDALLLKGVPINAFKNNITRISSNDEVQLLIQAMRAGVGKSFKVEDAWYDKIIILSDGDSDGNVIFSSFCVILLTLFPEYVKQGRVYRALPPLYKIKDKKRPFIKSKNEYFEVYVERIGSNIIIEDDKGKQMSIKAMKDFLYANRDYLDELQDLSKYFGVHPFIIEFICKHWGNKKFASMLKKRFPEMTVDGDTVEGVYSGAYQYIKINKRFRKNASKFIQVLTNEFNTQDLYRVRKKYSAGYEDLGELSIGELLVICKDYNPAIVQRYKGLGEIKAAEFRDTVLDPNNRQLIRLTISDFEKCMEMMKVLHDDGPKYVNARKELIKGYTIRKDELDN